MVYDLHNRVGEFCDCATPWLHAQLICAGAQHHLDAQVAIQRAAVAARWAETTRCACCNPPRQVPWRHRVQASKARD